MDNQIDKLESEIHEHLEIDHGDVTTYVNVFDSHPDYIHVMIGKTDNSGKLSFNKLEMFLTEDHFSELANFFSSVNSKVYLRDRAGRLEKARLDWMAELDKQVDFIQDDKDHINLNRPNLLRDIQDGTFARHFMDDYAKGHPGFNAWRREASGHPIEAASANVRALMPWLKDA